MASPGATPAKEKAPAGKNTPVGSPEEVAFNAPLLAKMADFLKTYKPERTAQPDMLGDRFRVDMGKPLPEFDTRTAKAYAVTDTVETSRMLFALVCEPGKVQRYKAIEKLQGLEHRCIIGLLAAGNVELSALNAERYVLIHERPRGIRLSELLSKKKIPANQQFIYEHILIPLATGLQQFSDLEISHGLVNPDNIYISESCILGPCVSEPCGYSQPYLYESLERMQAIPSAKGEGSTAQDFYALAVTLLAVLHGPDYFSKYPDAPTLIRAIMKEGAYNALMGPKEVPEVFYDFLRGVLTMDPEERWGSKQVLAWLSGKRFNVLAPPPPVDAMRSFEFGDQQATTRRELAHLFSSDWEHMIVALQNNQLADWVSVSLRSKELSDTITRLSRLAVDASTKNETQTNELLMNIVLLLDSQGPIRIRQLSLHIDGLETLCAELYTNKAHAELQILARFIETNMINYWTELQKKRHKNEYSPPITIHNISLKLDRLRTYIRNAGFGFGLERMLYDLNPDMPCQSPAFASRNVNSMESLLVELDRLAPTLYKEDDPLDRHIAAYLGNKLAVLNEIRLHDLSAIPGLANSRTMLALYQLAMAQSRCGFLRLQGLTHWIAWRLLPMLDGIHSRTLRQKLKNALMTLASSGNLPKMAEVLITADYAEADQAGFQKAAATYRANAEAIIEFQRPERIEYEAIRMGFNIAKMVAFIGLAGTLALLLQGPFL